MIFRPFSSKTARTFARDGRKPFLAVSVGRQARLHLTSFYFLTFEGVRVIDTDLASMSNRASRYADLFGLGQAVLTELRIVNEKRQ